MSIDLSTQLRYSSLSSRAAVNRVSRGYVDFNSQPELFPSVLADPDGEQSDIMRTFALVENQKTLNVVSSMSRDGQRAWWDSLSANQQEIYSGTLGYTPPGEDKGNLFQRGLSAVGRGLDLAVPDVIQNPIQEGLGRGLHYLDVIGDQPAHLFRTGYAMWEGENLVDAWMKTGNGERYFSQRSQDNALRALGGDRSQLQIAKELAGGSSIEDLLDDLGLQATDPEAQFEANRIVEKLQTPEMQDALHELAKGKVSPGRWIARNIGLDHGSLSFNLVSGLTDAGTQILLDPTLIAGKAVKASRLARYGINPGEDGAKWADSVDNLFTSTQKAGLTSSETVGDVTIRAAENAAEHIRTGRWDLMIEQHPQLTHMVDGMREWGLREKLLTKADGVEDWKVMRDFYSGAQQMTHLLSGRAGSASRSLVELPRMTRRGLRRAHFKSWMTREIDFLAEARDIGQGRVAEGARRLNRGSSYELDEVLQADDIMLPPVALPDGIDLAKYGIEATDDVARRLTNTQLERLIEDFPELYGSFEGFGKGYLREAHVGTRALAKFAPARGMARFLQGATRQLPTDLATQGGGQALRVYGPESTVQIRNLVELGVMWDLDHTTRRMWLNTILEAPEASRSVAVRGFLDTFAQQAGMHYDPASKDIITRTISRMHHMYSRTSIDEIQALGRPSKAAILPERDLNELVAIPQFHELLAATRRHTLMRQIGAPLNSSFINTAISKYWKPAVLLRLGFIPRAAGEEMLAFALRKPGAWTEAKLSTFAVADMDYDTATNALVGNGLLPGFRPVIKVRNKIRGYDMSDPDSIRSLLPANDNIKDLDDILGIQKMTYLEKGPVSRDLLDGVIDRSLVRMSTWAKRGLQDGFYRMSPNSGVARMMGRLPGNLGHYDPDIGFGVFQLDPRAVRATRLQFNHHAADRMSRAVVNANTAWLDRADDGQVLNLPARNDGETPMIVRVRSEYDIYQMGDPLFDYAYFGRARRFAEDKFTNSIVQEGMDYIDQPMIDWFDDVINDGIVTRIPGTANLDGLTEEALEAGVAGTVASVPFRADNLDNIGHWLDYTDGVAQLHPDIRAALDEVLFNPNRLSIAELEEALALQLQDLAASGRLDDVLADLQLGTLQDVDNHIQEILSIAGVQAIEPDEMGTRTMRWIGGQLTKERGNRRLLSNLDDLQERQREAIRLMLLDPDNLDNVRKLERFSQLSDGTPVARPLPDGQMPIYVPTMDFQSARKIADAVQDPAWAAKVAAISDDLTEEARVGLLSLADEVETRAGWQAWINNPNNAVSTPSLPVGFTDPRVAEEVSAAAQKLTGTSGDIEHALSGALYERTNFVHKARRTDLPPQSHTYQIHRGESRVYSMGIPGMGRVHPLDADLPHQVMRKEIDGEIVQVVVPGATIEEVIDEIAHLNTEKFLETFGHVNGESIVHEIMTPHMVRKIESGGKVATRASIDDISFAHGSLPREVESVKLAMPDDPNLWEKFVRYGFDRVIGPAVDSIIRQPLYTANFIEAYKSAAPFIRHMMPDGLREVAEVAATNVYARGALAVEKIDWHKLNVDEIAFLGKHTPSSFFDIVDGEVVGVLNKADNEAFKLLNDLSVIPNEKIRNEVDRILTRVRRTPADTRLDATELLTEFERAGMNRMSWPQYKQSIGGVSREFFPEELRHLDRQDFEQMLEFSNVHGRVENAIANVAATRAMHDSIPYIDSHTFRSQFQGWMNNVLPWHFAEEQFIKRWVRTLRHSPEALRRGQLYYHGLQTIGTIRKDPITGDDIFVYPGSAAATEAIAAVSGRLFGRDASIPIAMPLTAKVKYSTPGMDSLGVPSFSPLAAIPAKTLGNLFPELEPGLDFFSGERGRDRGYSELLVPASMRRVWNAVMGDPDTDRIMASASFQAIQYLEAAGLTPDENAPAEEHARFQERVQNWARSLALTQAMYSFVGPSAPSAGAFVNESPMSLATNLGIDLDEIPKPAFTELMGSLSFEDALARFVAENPDATPYTVFASNTPSGANIPETEEALKFMEDNEGFLRDYQWAGGWLIPAPEEANRDAFSYAAYQAQFALGYREQRDLDTFYREIKFRQAAPIYFQERERKDQLLAATPEGEAGVAERNEIRNEWREWRDSYMRVHPIFQEELESPETRQRNRAVIRELGSALRDPNLPDTAHTEAVRSLYRGWLNYEQALAPIVGDRRKQATEMRQSINQNFLDWGNALVRENPEIRSLWVSVFAAEAGFDRDEVG